MTDLALAATLRAAAARGGPPLIPADLREHVRSGREGNLIVFCVDASGSMGARRRMAQVKAAVLGLLTDAYQRRDRVALVTFRGDEAHVRSRPRAASSAPPPRSARSPPAAARRSRAASRRPR